MGAGAGVGAAVVGAGGVVRMVRVGVRLLGFGASPIESRKIALAARPTPTAGRSRRAAVPPHRPRQRADDRQAQPGPRSPGAAAARAAAVEALEDLLALTRRQAHTAVEHGDPGLASHAIVTAVSGAP